MAVSAADVKRLRELTGAGMMDCKRALDESDGDFDKAVELLRIKGELLLHPGRQRSVAEAERQFDRAIEVARQQGAAFWELRTAVSLARLRISQDRGADAHRILTSACGKLTEGFSTSDMRSAQAMIAPVEVPATRSNISAAGRPVRCSISSSTSAGISPRMPPPSIASSFTGAQRTEISRTGRRPAWRR